MAVPLKKIYYDYKCGVIDSRELLYRLSEWDNLHGETYTEFKKNIRLKRTIITELVRYTKLSENVKKDSLKSLSKKYLKDYLFSLVVSGGYIAKYTFNEYVKKIVSSRKILIEQYNKLVCKNEFWIAVNDIEKEIENNTYMNYKNKWSNHV